MVLPWLRSLGQLLVALALEGFVADRQHLVDQEHVGVDVDGHRERQPDVHAGRVVLHRLVDEGPDTGEVDDLVEASPELLLGKPEDGPVEEDVLPARSAPGWKPAPSSSSADTLPLTVTVPCWDGGSWSCT